jgi:hypothetical protein
MLKGGTTIETDAGIPATVKSTMMTGPALVEGLSLGAQ